MCFLCVHKFMLKQYINKYVDLFLCDLFMMSLYCKPMLSCVLMYKSVLHFGDLLLLSLSENPGGDMRTHTYTLCGSSSHSLAHSYTHTNTHTEPVWQIQG